MKKFFKKYTPNKDIVKDYKILNFLGSALFHEDLWRFSRIPFCRGVVIGIFWGWMPMFFQMIPAAYCAILFRANLPLSVAGVWISNPITMPPMMYFAYLFGNYILNIDPVYAEFQLNSEWIMNAMGNIWEPLLVGTMTIGILSSIAGYYIMHFLWRLHAYRRLKKRGK
jgi:uncharacterized protein (DUF2062 family)